MNKNEAILDAELSALKGLVGGTIDGVSGDPALAVLANFVNGVRLAQVDPFIARRLADAAETMVRGEVNPDSDAYYIEAIGIIRDGIAAAEKSA